MSVSQVETAILLLRDHFGPVVSNVGAVLLRGGRLPLPFIAYRAKLGLNQVKQSLLVLLQHQFVNVEPPAAGEVKGNVSYRCDVKRVLFLSRYPRYILAAKQLYGEAAELIVEELVAHGQLSLSQCVQRVTKRLEAVVIDQNNGCSMKPEEVKQKFVRLVETQFVCRCPEVDANQASENVPIFRPMSDMFVLPDAVDIAGNAQLSQTNRKRKADETENSEPDANILWTVNFDRFHLYFRDQYLIRVARNRVDQAVDDGNEDAEHHLSKPAEEVMRAVLRANELRTAAAANQSVPLSMSEIFRLIPDSANLVKAQVEQYLSLLCDDRSGMLRKAGESGGGLYVLDFSEAMTAICRATIEAIVQERYGSKGLRIFNLLLAKGYLEQNEIETFAMLPSKEGKELTYRLLADRILTTKEVPKTNDFAPSRTFYLFHVDIYKLTLMLCDRSYKSISKLILRRYHENEEHRGLLERQERLEAVISNIRLDQGLDDQAKEQHIREAEEVYLNVAEKEILDRYRTHVATLQQAETDLDETVLIFNLYMQFCEK